jgi:hypothetical protein
MNRAVMVVLFGALMLSAGLGAEVAAGVADQGPTVAPKEELLARLPQSVALRYWAAHPDQAPAPLRARLRHLPAGAPAAAGAEAARPPGGFNLEAHV